MYRYYKKIGNTDHISAWKSKGLSDESIKSPATSDNSLAPSLNYIGFKTRAKFVGSCLKQDNITFSDRNIVNIYIVYEINLDNFTLKNALFGAVELTKNAKQSKYKRSGCRM